MSGFSASGTATGLNFSLLTPSTFCFGPRLGNVFFKRHNQESFIQMQTPNFLTSTSRGVIPHLSRDHYKFTPIKWINVPFESFLEVNPPVPTLHPGENPMHEFLGYLLESHLLSLSLRDPADGREMPPNSNSHVSAYSLRGVRKVSPSDWISYMGSCKPDIIYALSDTPFTHPPYSQKRLTKSIERSALWLATMLRSISNQGHGPSILVHMAGATSIPARRAFAESLVEKLHGAEAEVAKPLETLDQGVIGYSFDLLPLRSSLEAMEKSCSDPPVEGNPPLLVQCSTSVSLTEVNSRPAISEHIHRLPTLLQASLEPLPVLKIRIVNTTQTPHEILRLISSVGIDLFDAYWAQRAADIGVALDFTFPVASILPPRNRARKSGKAEIGHNLYDPRYTHDFSCFSSAISDCSCPACSPLEPATKIYHGADDNSFTKQPVISSDQPRRKPGNTRSYVHHLLHTHEMSAHALLVMHNLSILERFFVGIRHVLMHRPESWSEEVSLFINTYDEELEVFEEARVMWKDVDLARGKGRLARDRAKS